MMALYLARLPAYAGQDFQALHAAPFAPLLSDLTFRWHAGEVLLDLVLIATCVLRGLPGQVRGRSAGDIPARLLRCRCLQSSAASWRRCMCPASTPGCGITFGLHDVSTVLRGVATGCVLSVLAVTYLYKFERFSRGVFLIDAVLLTAAIVATRSSFRIIGRIAARSSPHATRVAIYGAGMRGQLLVREMLANPHSGRNPVAFVDDNPAIRARRIVGVPVRGSLDDLGAMIPRLRHRGSRIELTEHHRQHGGPGPGHLRGSRCRRPPAAHGHRVSGLRLRVGVDGRAFASPAGGVRRYVRELYTAIALHEPDVEVVAIGAPPDAELPPALQRLDAIPFPTNLGWMLASMPLAARRAALDVYHAPAYTAPLWGVHPQVLTIHDVSYERRPEWNAYRNDPIPAAVLSHVGTRRRPHRHRLGIQPDRDRPRVRDSGAANRRRTPGRSDNVCAGRLRTSGLRTRGPAALRASRR